MVSIIRIHESCSGRTCYFTSMQAVHDHLHECFPDSVGLLEQMDGSLFTVGNSSYVISLVDVYEESK